MIPDTINTEQLMNTEEFESYPDKTYRLDFVNKRIIGKIDGKEAVLQFIRKVLSTDKYAYEIYDWYYGNEILSLVGMPYDYIVTECSRIVNEALTVDDRILDVVDFEYERVSMDTLKMSCVVRTIFGDINYSQEVAV